MGAVPSSRASPAAASPSVPQVASASVTVEVAPLSMNTPLPAAVKGTMDGEKPPMSKVEDLKKSLEPYKHYLQKVRPWTEFARLSKPGSGEARARLEANLSYYQINYAAIFLALMLFSIVTNPRCVAVISVLAVIWMAFLKKNDDPSWEVNMLGVTLGKTQRWMALGVITAIVIFCAVGQLLSSAACLCAAFVLVHGMLHPIPDIIFDDDDEVNDLI